MSARDEHDAAQSVVAIRTALQREFGKPLSDDEDVIDLVETFIDHHKAKEAQLADSSWQPIATAPKVHKAVLEIFGRSHGLQWFGTGYWFDGGDESSGWIAHSYRTVPEGSSGSFEPTHWRPLTKAPAR